MSIRRQHTELHHPPASLSQPYSCVFSANLPFLSVCSANGLQIPFRVVDRNSLHLLPSAYSCRTPRIHFARRPPDNLNLSTSTLPRNRKERETAWPNGHGPVHSQRRVLLPMVPNRLISFSSSPPKRTPDTHVIWSRADEKYPRTLRLLTHFSSTKTQVQLGPPRTGNRDNHIDFYVGRTDTGLLRNDPRTDTYIKLSIQKLITAITTHRHFCATANVDD